MCIRDSSTSDQSLAKWTQPAVHWVAIVIMILGSLPFTLYVATLRGNRRALIKDQQVQGLLGMLLVTWLVLGTWYWWTTQLHWLEALRHVALNVTSVVTTTGFALGDYSLWGNFSLMLFFYLGFVGGCSGSTAGGIKIFRFQVAYILLKANLNQLIHPRAVIKQKTAYEISLGLVGSEMCIRDRCHGFSYELSCTQNRTIIKLLSDDFYVELSLIHI